MSAALLKDASKQHTIADDLESVLHVLTWTTLCYVPHTMDSASLDDHLQDVYDQYSRRTRNGGKVKGALLAAGDYIPPELQLLKDSPLLGLLDDLSDPFVAVYGKPSKSMKRAPQSKSVQDEKTFLENLHLMHDDRLAYSKSPGWFQETIETALNKPSWPADDGSSELHPQVQLGKRPRSPSLAASNEVKFPKHHS